ncbi:uncharacterized protein LOC122860438 [Aphidius gifuensis]|uniref:uncharacterized protein LOC122860438 n=1 Tax=Aphidius gifuensis TaxID=684658 RepID=UPI001CDBB92E|nr:uncharacterized protein LOC122860438 [Aphidius gifuensis]
MVTVYLAAEEKLSVGSTAESIDKKILELSQTITDRLDELNFELNNVDTYFKNYLSEEVFSKQYEQVYDDIDRIDLLYKQSQKWLTYLKKNITWDLDSKTDQMISLDLDYPQSILFDISRRFFQIRNRNKPTFIEKFRDSLLNKICDDDLTAHYQLFLFYKRIIYTEVKGFGAMAFSYMWRHKNNATIYEMNEVKNERMQSIIKYTELFKNIMKTTRNFIRRCDVKYYKDNKTYASFENMYYTTVLFREHFEPIETIIEWEIPNAFRLCQLHNDCDDNNHRYDKICPGLIKNCQRALTIEYCQRKEGDQRSTKNYYWMRIRNLEKSMDLGDTYRQCQPNSLHKINNFHTDYIKNIQLPIYCDCIDDSIYTRSTNTIRAFSLLWSQTSANNMVATGARLVAKDRMIHIQLREGKLLPYGEIDKKTERWIPLPSFEYNKNFPHVAIDLNDKRYLLTENIDFILINHLWAKTICLQKLAFDEEHLLTGVRFNYEHLGKGLEKRLKLEAKFVGFNYQHGNITSKRKYIKQSCKKLPELILNNPDDPLKFETHPHDSKENQFITIRASDLIKDASQTTIPFFDLLEVAPETSVPLNGIELFHKGQLDGSSGGYISLKLYPLNLTMYMNPPLFHDFLNIENITVPKFGT